MKKTEIFLLSFLALSFLLSKYSEKFVDIFVVFAILGGGCYFYLSVYLLNEFRIKDLFKTTSYQALKGGIIVLQVLCGFAYSTAIVALVFKVMHFPGTLVLKIVAILLILIVTIINNSKQNHFRPRYMSNKTMILRVCIFSLMLLLP